MRGLMQDTPLTLDRFLWRAANLFPSSRIASGHPDGTKRTTFASWHERTCRLRGVLDELGVPLGARVGTLCWSTSEHLELTFGVPCAGRVLHTLNPRLFRDQLTYIIDHAEDEVLFVHHSLVELVADLLPGLSGVRHVVVIDGPAPASLPGVDTHEYEGLLASVTPADPVAADETDAASLCYTGGTTGVPKGVLYSHRSLVLHALGTMMAGGIGIHEADVVMPVVPLFHANAVGFAHAAIASGADLVLPGQDLSGDALAGLLETESVSVTCGVPTVWSAVLPELKGRDLSRLRIVISGASAVPPSLSESFREVTGRPLTQIWGMTETSPLGTIATVRSSLSDLDEQELVELRASVGMPVPGVEVRIRDREGNDLPWDGRSPGELEVRGWWVAAAYFELDAPDSFTGDGWLRTGDVATIDANGYVRIVDRLKDVIKSGGEWISSIELENLLMDHPSVAEAAVIGVADTHWGERPLACVVLRDGAAADAASLTEHLRGRVASWWLPDRFEFVSSIPRTAVGKFAKSELRARFGAELDTRNDDIGS